MKWRLAIIPLLASAISSFGQTDPAITSQPQSQSAPAGSAVTLSVTATGTAPLTYQWWNSAGAILDATNDSYSLNPAQTNNSDNYYVIVANDYGSVTSAVASLVIYLPVSISNQPQSQSAPAGSAVTLSVTATGTAPLTYQWWNSGGAILDATNDSYMINPAQTNNSDNYFVIVANDYGSVTSTVASLVIYLPVSISSQPQSQSAPAGSAVTLSVTATGTAPLTYQWWNSAGAILGATNDSYSLNPAQTNNSDNYFVIVANDYGSVTSAVASLVMYLPVSITSQPQSQSAPAGSAVTLSVTATGTAPLTYQWWNSGGAILDATNNSYSLNPAQTNNSDNYFVIVANDYGSVTSAVASLVIYLPVTITGQPQSQSAPAGSAVTLSVTATGTAPLTYQWWNSAGAIPDATNDSYSLNPAQTNNSDNYFVIVANDYGSVTSAVASLVIYLPVSISSQPQSQSAPAGAAVTLSVTATGTAPLTYQWWNSAGAILDATNDSYSLNPAQTNNSDNYYVIVANDYGSVTSAVASLVIYLPVTITSQPQSQSAPAGSTVTLSVTATGTAPLTYQWWNSAGAILNATNDSYSLNPAQTNNTDNYFVIVANDYGSVTSAVASLVIYLPVTITSQPQNQSAPAGSAVTLSVTASGTAPLTYQWWNSGGAILDATNASYSLNPAQTNNSDNYYVIVANDYGSVTSTVASLVIYLPVSISSQPQSQSAPAGAAVTLSVTATGTAPLTYQWWNSAGAILDATNDSYSLNPAQTNNSDNYYVIVANDYGSVTSAVASLVIYLPVSISSQPQSQSAPAGADVILSVTATGTAPLTYQWWNSAGAILNATNASYMINPAQTNNTDNYFVIVANDYGSVTSAVASLVIYLPVTITSQPQSQSAPAGSAVTLSVTATGTAPLTYQWWNSAGAILDATNDSYMINPAQTNNSDNYFVIVANDYGSVTSTVASLVIYLPVSISSQPQSQSAPAGATVTLSVSATGTAPLTYQWWNSAGAILDATNDSYMINPAQTNNTDNYFVIVANDYGSVTSAVASLVIYLPVSISSQPQSQSAPAGSTVTLSVSATGTAPLTYQWWNSAGAILDATNASYMINPAQTNNSDNYFVIVANDYGSVTSAVASLVIYLPVSISSQPQSQSAPAGAAVTLSVTATGTAPLTYQWWNSAGAILDATNDSYSLNPAQTNNSDNYYVIVANDYGSVTSAVASLVIYLPVTITSQPQSQSAPAGSTVTLSVTATGTAPLTYQWWNSAGAILNATNDSYSLNPAQTNNTDNYFVIVANDYGSVTSAVASLVIYLPVTITSQPQNQSAPAGSAVTLSVTATGTAPLTYQWWNSAGAILDATNASYSLNPAQTNNSDNYYVIVANDYGSVTSALASLVIYLPVTITSQPQSQSAPAGSAVTLSVSASGTVPLTYQWWNSAGAILDATNDSYSLNPAQTNNSDNYYVIVANDYGSVTSAVASLVIYLPVSITGQPQSQSAPAGSAVTLNVTASGTAPLTYQWWNSAGAILDATNASYSLNPAQTNNTDNYYVIVANDYGSVTSAVASLVIYLPVSISSQPQSQSAPAGSTVTLSVTATGTAPLTYQWWNSGGAILDATNDSYSLNPAQTNNSDNYYVIVANDYGSVTSAVASLVIYLPVSITSQPQSQSAPAGSAVTLSVTASGTVPLTYQWWNSAGAIPDATNDSYSLNPAQTNNSDNYYVIVANDYGSVTSAVASLVIYLPVSITSQPQSQSAPVGADVTLSVTATGTAPLSYQWWNSAGAIPDATNDSYSLNPAQTNNSDNYYVIVANDYGSVTSAVASLVIYLPVTITSQPQSQSAPAGSAVTLSVTATGTAPLTYQWQFNGTNLPNGIITTVAGGGNGGDGAATNASLDLPFGVGLDVLGNLFIADTGDQRIRKVDTNGIITTVAGNGIWGYSGDGGAATNASFLFPLDAAPDASGNLFIADQDNHRVRRVDTNGIITTVVGNGTSGDSGDGGVATNASLRFPRCIAFDAAGNLFIADSGGSIIRKVDTNGIITTVAGNGTAGYSGDGGAATNANLNQPNCVAPDAFGNLFIADSQNNVIREVGTNGIITTVAGNGTTGYSGDGGAATNASFDDPTGVAVDALGNLLIADSHNSLVRQVNVNGIISTVAGNSRTNQYGFVGGYSGDGGAATNASLYYPTDLAVDASGNWFIADLDNNRIRRVAPTTGPTITIYNLNTNNAGNYTVVVSNPFGSTTSSVATVTLSLPPSISVQPAGLSVPAGTSATLSVTASGTAPLTYQWWNSAGAIPTATNASYILNPAQTNNSGNYFVVVTNAYGAITSSVAALVVYLPVNLTSQPQSQTVPARGNVTLSVTASGTGPFSYQWLLNGTNVLNNLITTVAGNGVQGYSGDGGAAINASLSYPSGVAMDAAGNLFIADYYNNRIRKVDDRGLITTVAGNGTAGYSGDGGAATNASLSYPSDLALDAAGNLFIADSQNSLIRKVDTNGIITTVAGNGMAAYSGDGGAATNASLSYPSGVAVDAAGNLFIADRNNYRIRLVNTNGIITTVAGNGAQGYSGDGAAATNASLSYPSAVTVDASGNLLIADTGNQRIRQVDPNGIITTAAGNGMQSYSGDGGAATNASLNQPNSVGRDAFGNRFIADAANGRIREVNAAGFIATVAGNGTSGYSGDGGAATNASLYYPTDVAADAYGNLFIADLENYRIRRVALATDPAITIYNLSTNNAGNYTVIVSSPFGSTTSSVAVVTVGLPPSISVQPVSQGVPAGTSATLSVTASSIEPLGYQWWNSTGAILNATNASYSINPAQTNNSDNYFVVVTNTYGATTSSVASLVVYLPVTITSQPASQVVPALSTATFAVTASSYPTLFYQWTFNNTNLPGATSSTLVISNVLLANLGDYAVLVGNGYTTNTSATATLSMSPSITTPYVGATAVWGYDATLSVGAIGSGPLSYQWFLNGVAIPDATNADFNLSSVQFTNSGSYSVVVSSDFGSETNTALLVVSPAGTVLGMCASITITGFPGYTYVIQYTTNLADTNSWITLTNLTLQQPVELWVDTSTNALAVPHRFYRLLPGQ